MTSFLASSSATLAVRQEPSERVEAQTEASFEAIYDAHFDFVWRSVRRLGVPEHAQDDVVQDVFIVVHRRLSTFEGRSSLKTWLFGIVAHVVRSHKRSRGLPQAVDSDPDDLADSGVGNPLRAAEAAEAARVLHEILDTLSEERREVFVLMELEEMSAPEAAEALSVKLNTVYSRLRAARQDFEAEVSRRAARDEWRFR